jgi:hypothetical protein
VHLFAVAVGLPEVSASSIGRALESLGCEFGLDLSTAWSVTSREGLVRAALRPQRRLIAPLHATSRLVRAAGERLAGRLPRRSSGQSEERVRPEYPFPHAWLEGRLELIRELFDQPSSELWNMVSRPRVEALMRGSEADGARLQAPLLRAATVFWHFHGEQLTPHASRSPDRDGLAAPTAG